MSETILDNFITEVTEANFEAEVIDASAQTPILIDFWAEWCGPCKALGPILEKLAGAYQGAFRLAKINVDEAQQLAAAFAIRSIPTVMLVKDGRPVDGFTGALPEGQIRQFLDQHVSPAEAPAAAAADPLPADEGLSPVERVDELRRAAQAEPDNAALWKPLLEALLQSGDPAAVRRELDGMPAKVAEDDSLRPLQTRLELLEAVQTMPSATDLDARLAAQPNDWLAQGQLAAHELLSNQPEAGLERLLHVLEHADASHKDAIKKQLLQAFILLEDAALVAPYRRRMATLLF